MAAEQLGKNKMEYILLFHIKTTVTGSVIVLYAEGEKSTSCGQQNSLSSSPTLSQ